MLEKVDPYLRPLFDALYDMLDADRLASYMEKGIVEVAPLAFMRGRTLNDSFVILDEAQNTSPEQMQMFLTRLGFGSKVVVTGDVTQVDLPREQASGLIQVQDILGSIDDVAFVRSATRTSFATSSCSESSRPTACMRRDRHAASEVIPSVITVEIANRSGAEVDEDAVANLARRVLAAEGIEDGDLGLVFVAPAEMRALKRDHLGGGRGDRRPRVPDRRARTPAAGLPAS